MAGRFTAVLGATACAATMLFAAPTAHAWDMIPVDGEGGGGPVYGLMLGATSDNAIGLATSSTVNVNSELDAGSKLVTSGFGTDVMRVVVEASAGTVSLASTTGLTAPMGYPADLETGGGVIAFEGTPTNVDAGLNALRYTSTGSAGTGTVKVSASKCAGDYAFNPDNGHCYTNATTAATTTQLWDAAKTGAEATSVAGMNGYLATITSPAEESFIEAKLGGAANYWIGANDVDTEMTFKWVTGPEAGTVFFTRNVGGCVTGLSGYCTPVDVPRYNNWFGWGEPNNFGPGGVQQEWVTIRPDGWPGTTGSWDDSDAIAYKSLIEYSTADGSPSSSASVSRTLDFTVKSAQTISFGALSDQAVYFPPANVSATASSNLPVSFSSRTPGVCTSGGTNGATITFVTTGTCTIRASQAGDGTYAAAANVDQSFQIDRVPNVPTGVSATASAPGEATVSWTAPPANAAPITEYRIKASPGKRACITKPSKTSCVIPGLMAGPYTFTVEARSYGGYSQASVASSPVTVVTTVPGAPTKTRAKDGNGEISVLWDAPDRDGATSILAYEVSVNGGGWVEASSPYTVAGPPLVPISVRVRAVNIVGAGRIMEASATPYGPPSAPTNLRSTRVSTSKVRVDLDAPAGNGKPVKNYTIMASPGNRSCTNDATGCTITGLAPGSYTFTAVARNSAGTSTASAPGGSITLP